MGKERDIDELPEWAEDDRKVALVEAMGLLGVFGPACQQAGVQRSQAQSWIDSDEDLAHAMAMATEDALDDSESEMRRRGMGFRVVVRNKGGDVIYKRDPENGVYDHDEFFEKVPLTEERYDKDLLKAWLAGRRPKTFGDVRRLELTGKDGEKLQTTTINIVGVKPKPETIEDPGF